MDAFRCTLVDAAYQVLVNFFCHKRNHRCCYLAYSYQCSIKRHICIDFILLHALCPETFTTTSYIPVTHLIYKFIQCSCSFRNTIIAKIIIYSLNQCIEFGEKPFIHNGKFLIIQCIFGCIKFINICIQHEECISVPKCSKEFTLSFLYCLSMETVWQPWCGVDVEIPADCICSVSL